MTAAAAERLQKFLARAGVASRRQSEELIAAGRVTVNGQVAGVGDKVDPGRDAVKVDGKRIQPQTARHYLLLHKPRAVMSTVADPEGRPTVLELVPPALRKALVPVGRLDFLSEGLLLLTDDGDLAQRVAHPRYGCTKTYEVKVRGEPKEKDLDRLRRGISLDGRRTSPADIRRHRPPRSGGRGGRRADPDGGNTWWKVVLGEGRHRQIRDMFQRIGHPVMKLRRVAIGPVNDPHLKPGELRPLRQEEIEALRGAGAGGGRPRGGKAGGKGRGRRAAAAGAKSAGAKGAKPKGAKPKGANPKGAGPKGAGPKGAKSKGAQPRGAKPAAGRRAGGGGKGPGRGPKGRR